VNKLRGPLDGSAPAPVVVLRSVAFPAIPEDLLNLEQQINSVVYKDPHGNLQIA